MDDRGEGGKSFSTPETIRCGHSQEMETVLAINIYF